MIKIKLILFFLIFVCGNLLFAQTGWYPLNSGMIINLNRIQFVNSQTGWAGGHQSFPTYYIIIKTTNAGITWTDQRPNLPIGNRINSLFFFDANTGWIAGADGLFKTINGGDNYFALTAPLPYYYDCYFVNSQTGWVSGLSGADCKLIKTTDGGITWNMQSINFTQFEQINSIRFVNSLTGWCAGNTTIIKTTDGGINWITQSHPYCAGIKCVYVLSPETAWISADSGKILSTANGGTDWTVRNIGTNSSLNSISFINNTTGYIATSPRNIFKTTNTGLNWYPQMTDTASIFNSIYFTSNDTGYACGSMGRIFKTTTGGGTIGIKKINEIVPDKYSLSQNYPNPFNSTSNLKFEISRLGGSSMTDVKIIVYDVMGREVQTLVNERLQPGTYETTFDGSLLNSGVYFYKLETEYFTETKRMMLIK